MDEAVLHQNLCQGLGDVLIIHCIMNSRQSLLCVCVCFGFACLLSVVMLERVLFLLFP